ncbi:hypothetical protein [Devosia aurantiaca]|uniref:Solute-binding protein family 5 domain-containing protein n=1 Tax=Devosia aurantiaca TaxID=2714858 RepID=A0A6M1SQN6_9HYPH|nr:hypothetical protein [Devosia aurantiaca]NGP18876.1 hypothetical protein [Devosia aurantiaca]
MTAQGGPTSLRNLANPNNVYKPVDNAGDEAFNAAFSKIEAGADLDTRREAFAEAQAIAFENVLAIPFGIMSNAQGVRATVEGYQPYYNTRVSNVWLEQ